MAQNAGVLGFFARRLFGSNPADEDTDDDEQPGNGTDPLSVFEWNILRILFVNESQDSIVSNLGERA